MSGLVVKVQASRLGNAGPGVLVAASLVASTFLMLGQGGAGGFGLGGGEIGRRGVLKSNALFTGNPLQLLGRKGTYGGSLTGGGREEIVAAMAKEVPMQGQG